MRILGEIGRLGGEALLLWGRNFLRLGAWFCIGFGLHQLGLQVSARLGSVSQLLATMVFILGVLAWLAALIMMIHTLKPGLRTPQQLAGRELSPEVPVPGQVFRTEPTMGVLTAAVGPFLAVYAGWGFVEDEVSDLLFVNLSQLSYDVDRWSISFDPARAPFYALLTGCAWIATKIIGVLADRIVARGRRPGLWTSIPEMIADGTFVFGLFMTLATLIERFSGWWDTRAISVWLSSAWRGFLDALPSWQLWFELTLPQAIRDGADWIWRVLAPGVADRLLLPLMWLALTATVYGWRQFRGRELIAGTRLDRPAGRIGNATAVTGAGIRSSAIGTVAWVATDDLRTKYLPVITALRMLWRAGPRFVGGYLVLSAVLWSAERWFDRLLAITIGPPPNLETILVLDPVLELIGGLIFTTAAVALYAAAFDRAMAEVTGAGRTVEPPPRLRSDHCSMRSR